MSRERGDIRELFILTRSILLKHAPHCSQLSLLLAGRKMQSSGYHVLSQNMNNALMSGIARYDEGRAQVIAQHNNIENHLMRIRRTVPEIGL